MKKKLLFMISSMNIGGVEKSLLSLLTTIPREEYEITILMLEKKGGFLSYIPDYIKVEESDWYSLVKPLLMEDPHKILKNYIREHRYFKGLSYIFNYYLSKKTGNRYYYLNMISKEIPFNKEKYDVAIAYAGPTEIIDTYITHKVDAERKYGWVHFDISKFPINKGLYNRLYPMYEKIFIVSEESKDKLIEIFPSLYKKAKVIHNVVLYEDIKQKAKEDCSLDDRYNGIKIVTVGRISKEKGISLAIRTLKKLRDNGYDVRWYWVGDGNYKNQCLDMIKDLNLRDDFLLLGSKTNPYPYMKSADIYVQPSLHEGYCLTLSEAKCLEKPIVTTNFTGASEQIVDGKTGIIVNSEVNSLYDGLIKLIDNEELIRSLVDNLKRERLISPKSEFLDVLRGGESNDESRD